MPGAKAVSPSPSITREALEKQFAAALGRRSLDARAQDFLDQAFDDYVADEAPEVQGQDLAQLLAASWKHAEKRKHGQPPSIEIHPLQTTGGRATGYDLIRVVQDDRPFLVDSVMGELAEAGITVRALYHPVADEPGGRESIILVIIDPVPQERRDALQGALMQTLEDVSTAVEDHAAMTALMGQAIADLKSAPATIDRSVIEENVAFLEWLKADHFVFLGARDYNFPRNAKGGYEAEAPLSQSGEGLGVLRDPERTVLRRASEPAVLTKSMKRQLDLSDPVTVAKANARSRVHRRAYMDYIGVKRFGPDGRPSGETRFVGLFTAETYDQAASETPLLRRKVANVMTRAGKSPGSHNEKRLRNILETYPRDELFQVSEDELLHISQGILHLYDRPRIKIFARKDPFDRFVSVLAFIPRDRFDAQVRERIGRILTQAWGGRLSAWYPQLSDQPLVRVHYIIGVNPGEHPEPDMAALETEVAEAGRSWIERFEGALRRADVDEVAVGPLGQKWAEAFSTAYRARYDSDEAVRDLMAIDRLNASGESEPGHGEAVVVRAFRTPTDTSRQFRFKLYRRGSAVPLSDVLPILADMGLKTLEEWGHALRPAGDPEIHVHEFLLDDPRGESLSFAGIAKPFEDCFQAVWDGRTESDGFNRLVMELGVDWRQAALVRTLARYRQQTGRDPSQAVQEESLRDYPKVARAILDMFRSRFDPSAHKTAKAREADVERRMEEILQLLQEVNSLDQDRALRRIALLVQAIKRTNFYQVTADGAAKPYISIKIASRELEDLPLPKPYREIFVWAPHIEGAHLRFGPVARGGLRWSDRRDDFRTEVLGLVKAQQVKNAVIVPVGSKGGFFPKRLAEIVRNGGNRDAQVAEAIRAYKTFLSGLLDITDNLAPDGKVLPPPLVVRHEGDDPYLVVAADKGTATFSDIANGVSEAYGFWLGDAFASGGSVGYDHKVMGITARGAWEAVKRHFREMGKDIQSQPFTVVGVGDMSGDVFGNGMLLSKQIQLVAAFDHRDIFIDPTPDPATSFKERQRLFKLDRSSWQDYDKAKISKGGGVFSRSAKSIPLSAEIRAALDISETALDPAALMKAILKAPAELLYLGGIGTYVKAPSESDLQVNDKANDAVRVNAEELRVQVVGEGANLGLTQAGRIAFARNGGRINTDAIDNSAGVDSSDHEVNIKILTGVAIADKALKAQDRNALLASMTDEVGLKVLTHNYDQTLALSLQQLEGAQALDSQLRFMQQQGAEGRLDRLVEGLPDDARMAEFIATRQPLTRPELAVLMAYSKIELFDEIVASKAPDDAFFDKTLVSYFPGPMARFEPQMKKHRLKREIISTVLANDIVNMCGTTFPRRVMQATRSPIGPVVVAFEAARQIFRLDAAWDAVSALDLKIPAQAQLELYDEISVVLRRQTFWLSPRAGKKGASVASLIAAYQPTADALRAAGPAVLSQFERQRLAGRVERFKALGCKEAMARDLAMLRPLVATADIGDLAKEAKWPEPNMATLYHQVGAAFDFDRLRDAASRAPSTDHFDRMAVRRLIEDLMSEQLALTRAVAKSVKPKAGESEKAAEAAVDAWIGPRLATVEALRASVDEIEASGAGWTFAKLTLANATIREAMAAASAFRV